MDACKCDFIDFFHQFDRILNYLVNFYGNQQVKGGTKVGNVVEYAEKAFNSGEYRSVVWSATGGGITKCISCAEIMKRNFKLHQVTKLNYQK